MSIGNFIIVNVLKFSLFKILFIVETFNVLKNYNKR